MRYLVLSDVHGNLPALEKVLQQEKSEVDTYINLGDVVNYAPWSNECVELIADLKPCVNIQGNHEVYFLEGKCQVKHPLVPKFFEKSFEESVAKVRASITDDSPRSTKSREDVPF